MVLVRTLQQRGEAKRLLKPPLPHQFGIMRDLWSTLRPPIALNLSESVCVMTTLRSTFGRREQSMYD
jgi:hypothetical protein